MPRQKNDRLEPNQRFEPRKHGKGSENDVTVVAVHLDTAEVEFDIINGVHSPNVKLGIEEFLKNYQLCRR